MVFRILSLIKKKVKEILRGIDVSDLLDNADLRRSDPPSRISQPPRSFQFPDLRLSEKQEKIDKLQSSTAPEEPNVCSEVS